MLLSVVLSLASLALRLDNGLGITPPRGWRSWDAFENAATQQLQESMVDALVDRSRTVDGKPTSLLDLGYNRIGLDDSWQECGAGVNGSFHSADGTPLVKNKTFPSLKAMNAYARAKGIGSGWYLNSCDCCERGKLTPDWPVQMQGDVRAVKELGFDGLKLDSCGPSQHLAEWSELLNKSGWPVLVENCFDNASFPFVPSGFDDGIETVAEDACPMNLFRTGGDMRADWPLMLRRLQTIVPWLRLSRPKCWAYMDMLEVGNPPGGTGESRGFENVWSWRAHFGAWAITSSPLILSFDLTNSTKLDLVWDFITNKEALGVNSDWAGEAGRLVDTVYDQTAPTPVFGRPCSSSVDTQKVVLNAKKQLVSSSKNDKRCLSVPGCAARPPPPVVRARDAGSLMLAKCDGRDSQSWTLTGNPRVVTNVQSKADGGCWEINGCGGTAVDTDYGCKALPKGPLPCSGCCNMAWTFTANGAIVSGMNGRQCLKVSPKDESSVVTGPCVGASRELWTLNGTTIQSVLGGCIDNHASQPVNPQYGQLTMSDCDASSCDGADHEWSTDTATGQLVSSVAGARGEKVCAEVQNYMNHNSFINAVGCAPSDSVPMSQKWTVDPKHARVSVDVRFDATQNRSPGMKLCADIDHSATFGGDIQPGRRTISQTWSKMISGGRVAVLLLNADTEAEHDLAVSLGDLGLTPPVSVWDVWKKMNLGNHAAATFTRKVAAQDSAFLIFSGSPRAASD